MKAGTNAGQPSQNEPAMIFGDHRWSIPQGAKYPLISRTKCVVSLANKSINPLVEGTIAAFETIVPSIELSVETRG